MLELFNPLTRIFTINRLLLVVVIAFISMLIDFRIMTKKGLKRESRWVLILNGGLIGLSLGGCIALLIFA